MCACLHIFVSERSLQRRKVGRFQVHFGTKSFVGVKYQENQTQNKHMGFPSYPRTSKHKVVALDKLDKPGRDFSTGFLS